MADIDPFGALDQINLAEALDDDTLTEIGQKLGGLIEDDKASRQDWVDQNKEALKLASQIKEEKSFPWPNASNVKYPLVATAAIQFHARALPNLIKDNRPVKARVLGRDDEQGNKASAAERVSRYMSYQVLEEMDNWMDDMDRLLFILPIVGICHKKTYYSPLFEVNRSELVLPQDVITNYHAKDFSRARMTHRMMLDSNEIHEFQSAGLYLDVDLQEAKHKTHEDTVLDESQGLSHPPSDEEEPYEIWESHCWWDIDEDGYKEPYIITLESESKKVLRIVPRWDSEGVKTNVNGEIIRIEPVQYFTSYIFMPDPNSAVHGLGFGRLLGPLNESINTLINQLIDAGTLSNLQGGFLGRGVKIRGGVMRINPGEWKIVNNTGDDLRKNIVPLPIRDPSMALFNLLGSLVEAGERLSSVSNMMMGENPGQNQPATTSMAVLEQGLKVFSSIYKRVHRALGKEYKKLFRLNSFYLDGMKYFTVLDEEVAREVYSDDFDDSTINVIPASDPNIVSETQSMLRAQSLMEKLTAGLPLNVQEVTKQILEAERHENIPELMNIPEPQPDPEVMLKLREQEHKERMDQLQFELDTIKTEQQAYKDYTGGLLNLSKIQEMEHGQVLEETRLQIESAIQAEQEITRRIDSLTKRIQAEKQEAKKANENNGS